MITPAQRQEPTELSLQLLTDPANSYGVMRKMKPVPFVCDDVT